MLNDQRRLIAGAVIWLGVLLWLHPGLMAPAWAVVLLSLAALVIVPLAQQVIPSDKFERVNSGLLFSGGLALTAAFILPEGPIGPLLVGPWLGLTAVFALTSLRRLYRGGLVFSSALAIDAGRIYLVVGGVWALLARMGLRPLDFSEDIVMLTAVHFHYAGFSLPVLCGLAVAKRPGLMATAAVFGVVIGVPLTAVGITLAQIGFGSGIETVSAWITAAGGLMTAALYFHLSMDSSHSRLVRAFWGLTAVALTVGMVLAVAYGSRQIIQLDWLTIPWMRAVHGTANSIGFSLAGLLGWWFHQQEASGD